MKLTERHSDGVMTGGSMGTIASRPRGIAGSCSVNHHPAEYHLISPDSRADTHPRGRYLIWSSGPEDDELSGSGGSGQVSPSETVRGGCGAASEGVSELGVTER